MKSTPSRSGKKYFINFIDDYTRFCYIDLINCKDEAIDAFKHYKNVVQNQLTLKIKIIRSDRDREYESHFLEACLEYGISSNYCTLYTKVKLFGGTED